MADDHDSFEDAREVLERFFEIGQESGSLDPEEDPVRWRELVDEALTLVADDLELVTRDGTLRGPGRFLDDWEVQTRRFTIRLEDLRFLDAGGGTVVVLYRMIRTAREGDDHLTTWPAFVSRVRDGRIVFLEGYADGAQALDAVGLDPSLARQR